MTQATSKASQSEANQTEQQGFVSVECSPLDQPSWDELIKRCITGDVWHCLQWPHKTEFHSEQPTDFSASGGQVFNQDRELRWKRRGDHYEVLLLSNSPITDDALRSLDEAQQWLIRDLNANFYPPTETRFPQGVTYPNGLDVGQRYFMDKQTGIVQFVALRAMKHG